MKVIYVTGCLGFMGSYFTRKALEKGWMVYGVDKQTYAANEDLLVEFNKYKNFKFEKIKHDFYERKICACRVRANICCLNNFCHQFKNIFLTY